MTDLIWLERPELRAPVMVCAFKGWNDAGEAATAALSYIRGSFDAHDVARIDPEEFYDFTAVRPTVKLTEGSARELDVKMVITLGALLADVPHSRPVGVTGITSDEGLVERLGFEPPSYEGPTGIVGVLQRACADAGVPAVSLWASVPHYVAASPNPKVALALVRAFEGAAGVAVDGGELEEAADDYERQVTAAVASDPEVKAFVERLENAMDEVQAENPPGEGSLPSADTIARDFQRFLRQRGPRGSGPTSPPQDR